MSSFGNEDDGIYGWEEYGAIATDTLSQMTTSRSLEARANVTSYAD